MKNIFGTFALTTVLIACGDPGQFEQGVQEDATDPLTETIEQPLTVETEGRYDYGWRFEDDWEGRKCNPENSNHQCMTASSRTVDIALRPLPFFNQERDIFINEKITEVVDFLERSQDGMSARTVAATATSADLKFVDADIRPNDQPFKYYLYMSDVMHVACMSWEDIDENKNADYLRCNRHQASVDFDAVGGWVAARAEARGVTPGSEEYLDWYRNAMEHVIAHGILRAMGIGADNCTFSQHWADRCLTDEKRFAWPSVGLGDILDSLDWGEGGDDIVFE